MRLLLLSLFALSLFAADASAVGRKRPRPTCPGGVCPAVAR